MTTRFRCYLAAFGFISAFHAAVFADDDKDLLGAWQATSLEVDGMAEPADAAAKLKFTFKEGGKLLMRGNYRDDREEECTYKIDPKQSPKHLEFTPPKEPKPVLGIYELKGDALKICLRHASSPDGRPKTFETKPESRLILVVLKRQKPKGNGDNVKP